MTGDEKKVLWELCKRATPGPWEWDAQSKYITAYADGSTVAAVGCAPADREFIAMSREAVPELLEEIALTRQMFAVAGALALLALDELPPATALQIANLPLRDPEEAINAYRRKIRQVLGDTPEEDAG